MNPELILIVIFLVLVVIFPLIGRISGWSTLATFYRFSESFMGECWRFQSAEMRWKVGYNNCLTIGASASGLYISIFFLFRFGHPPLFIKMCQNTPQLCWGDEWPSLSPGGRGLG